MNGSRDKDEAMARRPTVRRQRVASQSRPTSGRLAATTMKTTMTAMMTTVMTTTMTTTVMTRRTTTLHRRRGLSPRRSTTRRAAKRWSWMTTTVLRAGCGGADVEDGSDDDDDDDDEAMGAGEEDEDEDEEVEDEPAPNKDMDAEESAMAEPAPKRAKTVPNSRISDAGPGARGAPCWRIGARRLPRHAGHNLSTAVMTGFEHSADGRALNSSEVFQERPGYSMNIETCAARLPLGHERDVFRSLCEYSLKKRTPGVVLSMAVVCTVWGLGC